MNSAEYDSLYREHYHRVHALCRRMLGHTAGARDAEDATQETFMRGYRAISRYKKDAPFGPWINQIGSNYCVDLLRRRKRFAEVFSASDSDESQLEDPTESSDSATQRLISAHRAEVVTQAVEALPEKYRIPVVLAYFADASYDDIATTLGITPNYVGVLLARGKQQLRNTLSELVRGSEKPKSDQRNPS